MSLFKSVELYLPNWWTYLFRIWGLANQVSVLMMKRHCPTTLDCNLSFGDNIRAWNCMKEDEPDCYPQLYKGQKRRHYRSLWDVLDFADGSSIGKVCDGWQKVCIHHAWLGDVEHDGIIPIVTVSLRKWFILYCTSSSSSFAISLINLRLLTTAKIRWVREVPEDTAGQQCLRMKPFVSVFNFTYRDSD